jgi:hypothetical protein
MSDPALPAAEDRRAKLEAIIARMRHDRARFQHSPGSADVVFANVVDDWADELEAELPLPVAEDRRSALHQVLADMTAFAHTKPSPQQTRQKSAREMVELFAAKLEAALLAETEPAPRAEDRR